MRLLIKKNVLIGFVATLCTVTAAPPAGAASLSGAEASLLRAVNGARAAHALAPVRVDARLELAARAHSREMLRQRTFSHGAFASRMAGFAVRGPVLAENLAWGVGSTAQASTVVHEWLASPEHRANLLRPGFRRIGLASLAGPFAGYGGARVITADFAGG